MYIHAYTCIYIHRAARIVKLKESLQLQELKTPNLKLQVLIKVYKMVKWIKSIEFISDYKNIGMGQGGHREDHMYYSRGAGI